MFGPDLFAGLALSGSIVAPNLPPRPNGSGKGIHQEVGDRLAPARTRWQFHPGRPAEDHPVIIVGGGEGAAPARAGASRCGWTRRTW